MEVFDNQREEHLFASKRALAQHNSLGLYEADVTLSFGIASSSNTSLRHSEVMLYLSDLEFVGKRSALAELPCKHRWSLDYYCLNCQSTTLLVCLLVDN